MSDSNNSSIILDPLCSGSVRSRIEGCDTYNTKTERDRCTMSLMGCTDRPATKPKEYSACELCGVNNDCHLQPTVGLRDECLKRYCDSTGNCNGTFPDKTLSPTATQHFSLMEAYSNPFH
jgi:hypothetical protein